MKRVIKTFLRKYFFARINTNVITASVTRVEVSHDMNFHYPTRHHHGHNHPMTRHYVAPLRQGVISHTAKTGGLGLKSDENHLP